MAAALRFQRKHENLYNVFSAHLCSTFIVKPVVCVYAQMTAVRRVLCIETVSAAVHLPVHLRKNAWEPICIVWMAATVLMVFKEPPPNFFNVSEIVDWSQILACRSHPAEWNMHCCLSVSMCLSWNVICTRTGATTGMQCLVSVEKCYCVRI